MNLKACTFERLAFISLGFGRGAQVGKTSLLEVEGTLQALGSRPNPRSFEEDAAFFLQCEAKIVRRHTS